MKNAVHFVSLFNEMLNLRKKRDSQVDGLGWADNPDPNVLSAGRVSLAVWSESSESSSRVNTSLLVCEQQFRLGQVGAC
jgi:hypothetical protein